MNYKDLVNLKVRQNSMSQNLRVYSLLRFQNPMIAQEENLEGEGSLLDPKWIKLLWWT